MKKNKIQKAKMIVLVTGEEVAKFEKRNFDVATYVGKFQELISDNNTIGYIVDDVSKLNIPHIRKRDVKLRYLVSCEDACKHQPDNPIKNRELEANKIAMAIVKEINKIYKERFD